MRLLSLAPRSVLAGPGPRLHRPALVPRMAAGLAARRTSEPDRDGGHVGRRGMSRCLVLERST